MADFLKQVLPSTSPSSSLPPDAPHSGTQTELRATKRIKSGLPPPRAKRRIAYKTKTPIPSTSSEVIYEASTPQPSTKRDFDDDDDVSTDDRVEPHVLDYGAMTVGTLASPYVSPYLYESKRRGHDTEYGIRRNGDGFMIGDSRVGVDHDANIHIKNVEFPATKGLWELLTRKKLDKKSITTDDLKQYKTVLKMANVHLEGYDPNANIRTSKSLKFKDVISRLFPGTRQSGVEAALRRELITY